MDDCQPETVRDACERLGFPLADRPVTLLSAYLALLHKWNRSMNLVGPASWRDMLASLIVDSFHLAPFVASLPLPESPRCWDLGSGAGLPGLPLRMLWERGEYTLVEAREKRALFLRNVLALYPLAGVRVFHGRAERFMPAQPPADMIVSRAFMPFAKLLALVEPFLAQKAFCLFLTLAPLPSSLPKGWTAAGEKRYTVKGGPRWFWTLQKK